MTSQMEDGVWSIVFIGLDLVADLSAYSLAVLNGCMRAGHMELSALFSSEQYLECVKAPMSHEKCPLWTWDQ